MLIPLNSHNLYPDHSITAPNLSADVDSVGHSHHTFGFHDAHAHGCLLTQGLFLFSGLAGSFAATPLNVEEPQGLVCEPSVIFHPHLLSSDLVSSLDLK